MQAQQAHQLVLLIHHGSTEMGFRRLCSICSRAFTTRTLASSVMISGHQILGRQLGPGFSTVILQGTA